MTDHLSAADLRFLRARGIDAAEAREQLRRLREGFAHLDVRRPATLNDGILRATPIQQESARRAALDARAAGRVQRFVPASGAASRMFQSLLALRHREQAVLQLDLARSEDRDVERLFEKLDRFPFASALAKDPRSQAPDLRLRLAALLDDDGLGYASLPKGLIPFHRVAGQVQTAFEAQLAETSHSANRVHFTVGEEFLARIQAHLQAAAAKLAHPPAIDYSVQSPATDTLAGDAQGAPLRAADGNFILRPGGHGSLLRNLAALDADIVTLQNIDNVAAPRFAEQRASWKLLLIGLLVGLEAEIRHRLQSWDRARPESAELDELEHFCATQLGIRLASVKLDDAARRDRLRGTLERPLRVCGMVLNQGEPGGGPFWVRDAAGNESLQIVEASQIDRDDAHQSQALAAATHFNPVDLVCGLRDPNGQCFDLSRFVDPETGFLSEKSKDGVTLRALERPGLWNGSMAHWNTLFVEVPPICFTPVKTVLDLLRPEHQGD